MLTVTRNTGSRTLRDNTKATLPSLRRHNDSQSERARLVEALSDLHDLLEEYAPSWYTEEHHRKAESALHPGRKF